VNTIRESLSNLKSRMTFLHSNITKLNKYVIQQQAALHARG
jgi:hypothetical protein